MEKEAYFKKSLLDLSLKNILWLSAFVVAMIYCALYFTKNHDKNLADQYKPVAISIPLSIPFSKTIPTKEESFVRIYPSSDGQPKVDVFIHSD